MGKVFGFIIFIIIASIIVFYLFIGNSGRNYSGKFDFVKFESQNKVLSMREIDSLTAEMNYHFTIKNKIDHSVKSDSIKIPVKSEIPSG